MRFSDWEGSLGERPREKRIILFLDNNAAAGVLEKAPSRLPGPPALIESFWGLAAQLSASCRVERVSLKANLADAPRRSRPLFEKQAHR